MNILQRFFGKKYPILVLSRIEQPKLPNGAIGIVSHRPSFAKGKIIKAGSIDIVKMAPNISYRAFVEENAHMEFLDATVLDSMIEYAEKNDLGPAELVKQFLGDFAGQLFFLNTIFSSRDGNAFAFLNWNMTLPAFRYLCPAENPIRHDAPVYAAVAGKV